MENKPKNLWKNVYIDEYQKHVTISTIDSTTELEDADERIVYMEDLEKRKQVYGICGECNEPEGGFGKIYSAKWPEGNIEYWDIENQKWQRCCWDNYALKSLNNSSNISSDFLNEIKSHLQIHLFDVITCYGITQDPKTKDDLGMCQPANKKSVKEEGIYGVLPYMAPEVLRGHQYTKAADIYSFGIIMNEFLSEEIPYGDISHDEFLAVKICKGQRPKISEDVPKLLTDLIFKCWDAEIENRPTAKELYQKLTKWNVEISKIKYSKDSKNSEDSEIYSQIKVIDEIGKKKFESRSSKDKSKNIQTHPQAIYTSRLLNFKNLPKPVNSSDLSSFQFNSDAKYAIQSTLADPISECFDVQLSESELNEICQDDENNIES
ncbi:uncharacterized protein OCT59_020081 [Rhizophagus irregularis]|uniref:uncharacterized protein n=1 Tax=Rhizophagus irregularis TaxID=588596 RepID=UPI0033336834|nr:hypothetical protein OCT59_020081 [Rhizophagus irregularis]